MTIPLPRGHYLVTFLTTERHAGFGVNGFIFHEHGFDTIYRAMNFMAELDDHWLPGDQERALSPRLWAVDYSTDVENPRVIPLHKLHQGRTSAAESTSGSYSHTEITQ